MINAHKKFYKIQMKSANIKTKVKRNVNNTIIAYEHN